MDNFFIDRIKGIPLTKGQERIARYMMENQYTICQRSLMDISKEAGVKEIFEAAREKDIYVRYFDKPRINNYLRITIGTDEEMEKFLKFLTSFLKSQK